ncbi:unnamed protein product [Timema podura]|uniref:Uncharacterized protein n=1 Tax=Timema podura TaxID=61482 RepID=A0ABN7P1R1_TIMPD|nr:unnamed protein product [Timema podura]
MRAISTEQPPPLVMITPTFAYRGCHLVNTNIPLEMQSTGLYTCVIIAVACVAFTVLVGHCSKLGWLFRD